MDTPVTTAAAPESRDTTMTLAVLTAVLAIAIVFALSSAFYSNWYAIFRVIHVLVAVFWVGGGVLLTVLGLSAKRRRDPAEIVMVARQAAFVGEKLFAPAGLVVLAMGIAMMINTDWGWGRFWVVAGLVGYAATFVTGIAFLSPLAKKIERTALEQGDDHPDTLTLIDRILFVARIDVAVLLLVVADMVVKPFS